jgi:hypothetical protein
MLRKAVLALSSKIGFRLQRALRCAIAGFAITIAAAFCAAVHAQQKPLTVEDAIALARPITDREPSVHSVEVRGRVGLVQFTYLFEAPDRFEGLNAVDDPKFTYFAAAGSRAIFYDPRQGELLDVTGIVPGIDGRLQGDELAFGYTFYSSKESDPSWPVQPGLHIDLPSILGSRNLTNPKLQSLPGGKYRLVFASEKWTSLAATIDPSQSFAFADIEIGAIPTSKNFIEIHVNRVPPATTPPIPSSRELRQSIAVRDVPFNFAVARFVALLGLTPVALSPKPIGLREGVRSPARRQVESQLSAMGETVNWDIVDANLKRDIPKLQQVLPLP